MVAESENPGALTVQQRALRRRQRRPRPVLPSARGPLTEFLFDALTCPVHAVSCAPAADDDPLDGEDSALALYCCYELHYRGFAGVDEGWEWEPTLLSVRRDLERSFDARLREEVGDVTPAADVATGLQRVLASANGPSLSAYLVEDGTLGQLLEFCVHRTAYQLKEADPHSWALPRLEGAAKAALVQIQADEYGKGVEKDIHAELYALSLEELGLDARYGAYLEVLPGVTLAAVNLASYFGLHRRLRGALVGHLAGFEMTSVEPMARYSAALRRHGFGPWARLFYDTHVVADARHQTVAARDLAGGLVRAEPELLGDVLYGAEALTAVEGRFTRRLLDAFHAGRSSLRAPVVVR